MSKLAALPPRFPVNEFLPEAVPTAIRNGRPSAAAAAMMEDLEGLRTYEDTLRRALLLGKEENWSSHAVLRLPEWKFRDNHSWFKTTTDGATSVANDVVTVRSVIAWERLNVLWNMATLEAASAVASKPVGGGSHLFERASRRVEECIAIIHQHECLADGKLSVYLSHSFLTLWKKFLHAQTQRSNVCSLHFGNTPNYLMWNHRLIAQAATAGVLLMQQVVSHCNDDDQLLAGIPVVTLWKESAAGWKNLFAVLAEYHQSFVHEGPARIHRACLFIADFLAVCRSAQSLHGLATHVNPLLHEIRAAGVRSAMTKPSTETTVLAEIEPRFFVPLGASDGYYMKEWQDSSTALWQKKKPKVQSTVQQNKTLPQTEQPVSLENKEPTPEPEPEPEPSDDFAKQLGVARDASRWLLVVLQENGETDLALRRVLKECQVVREILSGGFVIWEKTRAHPETKAYQDKYEVKRFPHLAIFDPRTASLMWRKEEWDPLDPLLADRFADAALTFCGYNAYDGLPGEPKRPPLQGNTDPPTHLVYTAGGFRAALEHAGATKRFLLVNLQCDTLLASHVLNRDVWRNDAIENLIQEGFVLWQKLNVADEGRVYASIFQVQKLPHVAILDPFTGRIVWRKEGWTPQSNELTAASFAEVVVGLPTLDGLNRPASLSRQPSIAAPSSEGEMSWELASLLDSWERLSSGTSEISSSEFDCSP